MPNRRLPMGHKFFSQRTLRLCGELAGSLSALIGENLRLICPFRVSILDLPYSILAERALRHALCALLPIVYP